MSDESNPITVEDLAVFKANLLREMHQLFGGRGRDGALPARSGKLMRQYETLTNRDATSADRKAVINEFASEIAGLRDGYKSNNKIDWRARLTEVFTTCLEDISFGQSGDDTADIIHYIGDLRKEIDTQAERIAKLEAVLDGVPELLERIIESIGADDAYVRYAEFNVQAEIKIQAIREAREKKA